MQHNIAPYETPVTPDWTNYFTVSRLPTWVPYVASAITSNRADDPGVNGISFDNNGDLMLYRKISPSDWVMFPELLGVKEVWLMFDLPYPETV